MTYFLICCVALVWGIIFREVFLGSGENSEFPVVKHAVHEPYFNMVDHAHDRVIIDLNHANPFLSAAFLPQDVAEEIRPEPANVGIVVKPQMNWTGITYKGQIYNTAEKRHVAIIDIKGKEVMLSEGQKAEGLKFIKRTGDSIKVEYHNAITYLSIK